MQFEILYRPAFPVVRLMLQPGEVIRAESGAMISMTREIELSSGLRGGVTGAIGRMLSGESAFQSTFTAARGSGELLLAPSTLGDVQALELRGDAIMVTSGAFLASTASLSVRTRTTVKGFLVGEGFFIMRVSGEGLLFLSALGAIHTVELQPGEELIVDTGHVLAFSEIVQYRLRKAARSFVGSLTSGEGIAAHFTGPGVIYMQTRSPHAFGAMMAALAPES